MNIIDKRELRRKLRAAVAMLLVSTVLLMNSSYAWLVLATAPEVTGVTSVIGANGNLEIALATTEHLRQLQENDMYEPEDAAFVMANGDAVHDNVLWGNLVDVMSADYGLYTLDMRPALLNVVDGAVAEVPVSLAGYGADGRMEAFDMEKIDIKKIGMSAVFSKEKARPVAGTVTMDRASLEAGLIDKEAVLQNLLDNVQYGVRVAGPLEYTGAYDLESENITVDLVVDGYCFALDLLVRTNAPVANLMLQTEGALRVQTDDELLLEEYQGQGSFIDLQNPLMTAALNVVFADTLTGKVHAVAQPNPEDGKLWITFRVDENGELIPTAPEDAAMILPLTQNRVTALTAWVYLNGNLVRNASAMTQGAMEMLMNLQFSTDAVLNPAYAEENAEQTYTDRPEFSVPTLPTVPGESVDPSAPTTPTTPAAPPASDIIEADYYLGSEGDGNYTVYTLNDRGERVYELQLEGTVDEAAQIMTINSVGDHNGAGIVIPAVVTDTETGTDYGVKISKKPFTSYRSRQDGTSVSFVAVDGKKVSLTDGVITGLFESNENNIGEGLYYFSSIDLRGLDTSSATSMRALFEDCRLLREVNLSGIDTSNVTDMRKMFYWQYGLTSLDLSSFDTSRVTDMNSMFSGCTGLTSLDLSGFDTGNVTDMNRMFFKCDGLTNLDVGGFDTGNVTDMGFMFYGSTLTSLDVSGFDTGSVTNMSKMFYGCDNLTSLDLSGWDTGSVTDMNEMFHFCDSLMSLDVSGWDAGSVTNMSKMFSGCSSLTSLDVSGFETAQVTDMSSMFSDCSGLKSMDVSGFDTAQVTDMSYMFSNCTGLTTMDLRSFDTSNVTDMRYMFNNCKNVQSWYIVNLDTSSVTNMSHTFYNCQYLHTSQNFYFDISNVTNLSYLFYGCAMTAGGDLDLTNLDVSSATDMSYMFANTFPLGGSLDISNWDLSDVNTTGMFSGCGASVTYPA